MTQDLTIVNVVLNALTLVVVGWMLALILVSVRASAKVVEESRDLLKLAKGYAKVNASEAAESVGVMKDQLVEAVRGRAEAEGHEAGVADEKDRAAQDASMASIAAAAVFTAAAGASVAHEILRAAEKMADSKAKE